VPCPAARPAGQHLVSVPPAGTPPGPDRRVARFRGDRLAPRMIRAPLAGRTSGAHVASGLSAGHNAARPRWIVLCGRPRTRPGPRRQRSGAHTTAGRRPGEHPPGTAACSGLIGAAGRPAPVVLVVTGCPARSAAPRRPRAAGRRAVHAGTAVAGRPRRPPDRPDRLAAGPSQPRAVDADRGLLPSSSPRPRRACLVR